MIAKIEHLRTAGLCFSKDFCLVHRWIFFNSILEVHEAHVSQQWYRVSVSWFFFFISSSKMLEPSSFNPLCPLFNCVSSSSLLFFFFYFFAVCI